MLTLTRILGSAVDPDIGDQLHQLEHEGRVESLWLAPEDTQRHRLRLLSDQGTDCAIALDRRLHLFNGAVLLIDAQRAIVVRTQDQQWLRIAPLDAEAALELGYFAGNMHWAVRFEDGHLLIAQSGSRADYLARLEPILADGRAQVVEP
ncbi:urease accessory protein UreE [Stutzerimonas stutzeri]|jgi:urease accessory protein|uniref:urease accessory protein UreE n=1 Tax=Pseudomonadaceae TaxID=135621 RepID=UPI000FD2F1EB|nr:MULTISPECIES: urease accessory protein UreE [Pseudomonadaceae]RUI10427.1 urease accessory protein UreE [Pseudomonas aeruginosa]UIP31952.1 urease accessory protein UreE [Stutzerimonas kunmingensis]